MRSWLRSIRQLFASKTKLVPIYLALNLIVSLVSNKLVFILGGAVLFSSYSLVKNYINVIVGASTLNAQNSMIYVFPKLQKEETHSVTFYFSVLAVFIATILTLLYILLKERVVSDEILYLTPLLVLFQIGRFKLIFRKKYLTLIAVSGIAIVFYGYLWLFNNGELNHTYLYLIYLLPFLAGIGLILRVHIALPRIQWNNFKEFIVVSVKSWLPNTISAFMVLSIRETYVKQTLETEFVAIYDMGLGLSAVIFGFILSSMNLILLPKFVEKRLTLNQALNQYGLLSSALYIFLIIFTPELLIILYDSVDSIYIIFARAILIVDMVRVYNIIIGLYLFSKGNILFSTLIDSITWIFLYLAVVFYLKDYLFIYQSSLAVLSIIVLGLYLAKVKYDK